MPNSGTPGAPSPFALSGETEREAVGRAILAYLEQHPDANDTVEGIRHFWLPDHSALPSEQTVTEALEDLIRRGLVIEIHSPAAKEKVYGGTKKRLRTQD